MPSNAEISRRTFERAAQAVLDQLAPRPESPHARHHAHMLVRLVGRPSIRVMLMGSAAVPMMHEMGEQGAYAVGVDYSLAALKAMRREVPDAQFVCADLRRLSFARSAFDAIFTDALLGHIEKREFDDTVRGIRDALRPGGVLGVRLKLGEGEGLELHKQGQGHIWRSYWQPSAFIDKLYMLDFDLRHEQEISAGKQVFLILRREY